MSLQDLHWKTLKKMVEAKGAVYGDKDEAVLFLSQFDDETDMLDRGRPFGTIHGLIEEAPTAAYSQDGHLFDGSGKKVG